MKHALPLSRIVRDRCHCGSFADLREMRAALRVQGISRGKRVNNLSPDLVSPDYVDPALIIVMTGVTIGDTIEAVAFWVELPADLADEGRVEIIDGRRVCWPRPHVLEALRQEAERLFAAPGFLQREKMAA